MPLMFLYFLKWLKIIWVNYMQNNNKENIQLESYKISLRNFRFSNKDMFKQADLLHTVKTRNLCFYFSPACLESLCTLEIVFKHIVLTLK